MGQPLALMKRQSSREVGEYLLGSQETRKEEHGVKRPWRPGNLAQLSSSGSDSWLPGFLRVI